MCNIAGYTGSRRAAPILIEMLRRQEGLNGGFFTGIVTIAEDGLHYAKVLGDLDTLLKQTDAMNLPGTTGLIHSRTPGGGGAAWGHPFISGDGQLGLVVNGHLGAFRELVDYEGPAQRLRDAGCRFATATREELSKKTRMQDGVCVHVSEMFCMQTEANIRGGKKPLRALMDTLSLLKAEVVLLSVHAAHPGHICVARANMPMFWGRAEGESFLATTPTALPDLPYYGVDLLPANAGSEITSSGCRTEGCVSPEFHMGQLTAGLIEKAGSLVKEQIEAAGPEGVTFPQIADTCRALFPQGTLPQTGALGYSVLDSMLKSGQVKLLYRTQPGMTPRLIAPVYRICRADVE